MDTAPDTGDPRLVGGIVIRSPLQRDGLGRPVFKTKHIVGIRAKAAREVSRTRNRRKHFRGGSAESAMAREVARKRRRDEGRPLIRKPVIGMPPNHAAVLGGRISRRTRPSDNGDFAW